MTQRLGKRLIGDRNVLIDTAEQHQRALLVRVNRDLTRKPRLALARFTTEQHDPPRPA